MKVASGGRGAHIVLRQKAGWQLCPISEARHSPVSLYELSHSLLLVVLCTCSNDAGLIMVIFGVVEKMRSK